MPDIRNYVRYPDEDSGILNWAPTVVRGAGAILPGGFIGAGGNALLEAAAQTGERALGTRSEYNPTQIATQAGIGAIPFGKAAGLAKTLGRGALLGSGATLATQQAETGLHAPTSEELGGVAIGGLLGAGGAGIARSIQNRMGAKGIPIPEVESQVPPANIGMGSRTGTAFEPGPIPTPIMKSGTISINPQQFTVASPSAQGMPRVNLGQRPASETPEFVTKSGLKGPTKGKGKTEKPSGVVKAITLDKSTGKINLGGPVVETPTEVVPTVENPIKPRASITTEPYQRFIYPDITPKTAETTSEMLEANLAKTEKPAKGKTKIVPHPVTGRPVEVPVETPTTVTKGTKKVAAKLKKVAAQIPDSTTKVETPRPKLPKELSKANPTYGKYELEFADDIDRAIYIVGGKGESKSHAKYKDWLIKTVGMPEGDIPYASKHLRNFIKTMAKEQGGGSGKVTLPRFNSLEPMQVPKGQKGVAHEMMPRKPRGSGTSRMFYHQEKPRVPPSQQIPIPPNKVTIPGPGAGSTEPLVKTPLEQFKELSTWEKIKHIVFNESRQAQTSMDLSFPLRQGINAITHRKEFGNSLKAMWEAAGSEAGHQRIKSEIETDSMFGMMQKAGVNFTDVAKDIKGVKLGEESMKGSLLNAYVPPIGASSRAYTTMANKLRSDLFKKFANDAIKAGIDLGDGSNENARAIADIVNDMTGRGKLPFDLERIADKVNNVFFSPKLISSRLNMFRRAFQDPRMIGQGVDPKLASQLRKEAIRSMAGVGGMALAGGGASAMLFDEPAAGDPLSTDFGKLKLNDKTRIDLTGGYQQYVRAAAQLASGMANVQGKKFGDYDDRNRLQTSSRFLRNKLAPVAASIVDWMAGQNVIGEEFSAGKEAKEMMMPLILQDLEEIYREDSANLPIAGPAAFFGAGVQSYGEDENKKSKKGKRVNTPGMFKVPQVKLYQPGT